MPNWIRLALITSWGGHNTARARVRVRARRGESLALAMGRTARAMWGVSRGYRTHALGLCLASVLGFGLLPLPRASAQTSPANVSAGQQAAGEAMLKAGQAAPQPQNRPLVERRIQLHEQALAKSTDPSALTPIAAASTRSDVVQTEMPAQAQPAKKESNTTWWLWATIGAVVVGTVVAAVIVNAADDKVQPPIRGDVGGTIKTLEVRFR